LAIIKITNPGRNAINNEEIIIITFQVRDLSLDRVVKRDFAGFFTSLMLTNLMQYMKLKLL
jgi:hypothetical protein